MRTWEEWLWPWEISASHTWEISFVFGTQPRENRTLEILHLTVRVFSSLTVRIFSAFERSWPGLGLRSTMPFSILQIASRKQRSRSAQHHKPEEHSLHLDYPRCDHVHMSSTIDHSSPTTTAFVTPISLGVWTTRGGGFWAPCEHVICLLFIVIVFYHLQYILGLPRARFGPSWTERHARDPSLISPLIAPVTSKSFCFRHFINFRK